MSIKIPEDFAELREGFAQYLAGFHANLSHHHVICSDAFFITRYNIGVSLQEALQDEDGIRLCKEKLEAYFTNKGRKNPNSDTHTYTRAVKLLREYVAWKQTGSQPPIVHRTQSPKPIHRRKTNPEVVRPCKEEVAAYLDRWKTLENYALQESALNKLFFHTYPLNNNMDDVLIKVSVLNDFYSTNIYSPYSVAKQIVSLDIDARLHTGDATLVGDIAQVTMDSGKIKNFYSFATKYCSHHMPLEYPIYDSYVDLLLRYFRDVDGFADFKNDELKDYPKFKQILLQFRDYYDLAPYSLKEIDMYLWQMGKIKFPKKYT